jgi:hypothetical protein
MIVAMMILFAAMQLPTSGSVIGTFGTLPIGVGYTCGEFSYDEPAITRQQLLRKKGGFFTCGLQDACFASEDMYEAIPTCADKTRILEHDEQTPPRYWCHAPQVNVP